MQKRRENKSNNGSWGKGIVITLAVSEFKGTVQRKLTGVESDIN
jgi:hypothetical protein